MKDPKPRKTDTSWKITTNVRAWLKQQGITNEEAARRLDITEESFNVILCGRPFGASRAHRWAQIFGLSERYLLTGKGPISARATAYNRLVVENDELRTECKRREDDNKTLRETVDRYRSLYGPLPQVAAVTM